MKELMSSEMNKIDAQDDTVSRPPWYKLPIVWLVIGGPLVVVIASLITVGIAVKNVDPVLDTSAKNTPVDQMPAVKARNHAAEPGYQPAER